MNPVQSCNEDMISALIVCSFDGPRPRYAMLKSLCAQVGDYQKAFVERFIGHLIGLLQLPGTALPGRREIPTNPGA